MIHGHVVKAVFRRDFLSYFSGPTGYVFISLFIVASAVANFVYDDAFFRNNLANLDQLNRAMPYLLLFFIPAITMNAWAEERKQGTDTLLLTLPARDFDIVFGKYLAALGIYSVALLFSLSNVIFLWALGTPDFGLMFGTYFGYWLMGVGLVAAGMVGSLLSNNATVGFILGALICGAFVFPQFVGLDEWTLGSKFKGFGDGMISFGGLVYFLSVGALMLFLNVILVSKRHWSSSAFGKGMWLHQTLRVIAVLVAVASLSVLGERVNASVDATAEQLHSVSDTTRDLLGKLSAEKPVLIRAYISPEVPQAFVEKRLELIMLLEQFDSIGGDGVQLEIVETEPYTDEATEAEETFGIVSREVAEEKGGQSTSRNVFLGVAFTCGVERDVIPFMEIALPIEYELLRSVMMVAQLEKKKKVGVLETDVSIVGTFDFATGQPKPEWQLATEMKKQYEVVNVPSDKDYPSDLDVLIAFLPSTLTQDRMDRLQRYITDGHAVLILEDPVPHWIDFGLAPRLPKRPSQSQFPGMGMDEPEEPKGRIEGLFGKLGLTFPKDRVVWDNFNPFPYFRRDLKHMWTFIGRENVVGLGADQTAALPSFNPDEITTSGLETLLLRFSGEFVIIDPSNKGSLKVAPLLVTGRSSGMLGWDDILELAGRGSWGLKEPDQYRPDGGYHVVAARVTGQFPSSIKSAESAEEKTRPGTANVIVIADAEFVTDAFFDHHRQSTDFLRIDNTIFILNCVDQLIGDTRFIDVRKRRSRQRTLEQIEKRKREFEEVQQKEEEKADEESRKKLDAARQRIDDAVRKVNERGDIDIQEKLQLVAITQEAEERKFEVAEKQIKLEQEAAKKRAKENYEQALRGTQKAYTVLAIVLPPIPALLLGFVMFIGRMRREYATVSEKRLL